MVSWCMVSGASARHRLIQHVQFQVACMSTGGKGSKSHAHGRHSSPQQQQQIEYLYGNNSVVPALEHGRRRLVRLLVREDERFGRVRMRGDGAAVLARPKTLVGIEQENRALHEHAVSLANQREVPVVEAPASQLDRLSGGRPHQGLVLAAFPPRVSFLTHLGNCDLDEDDTNNTQHLPDTTKSGSDIVRQYVIGSANYGDQRIRIRGRRKYPIWLALDQIADPQNLGAILRTAYYFNIDGVVVTERESAPFSPTASKASAGAMEAMRLFSTDNLSKFLKVSATQGWQIIGTDINTKPENRISIDEIRRLAGGGTLKELVEHAQSHTDQKVVSVTRRDDRVDSNQQDDDKRHVDVFGDLGNLDAFEEDDDESEIDGLKTTRSSTGRPNIMHPNHVPTILVLGNEGRGMRSATSRHCHGHLVIDGGHMGDVGSSNADKSRIDSLNVSVATGILLNELMASSIRT